MIHLLRVIFAFLLIYVGWGSLAHDPQAPEESSVFFQWLSSLLFGSHAYEDKLLHFFAYGALGVSGALARLPVLGSTWILFACLAAYGTGLEGLQALGGVRSGDWLDIVANIAGGACGVFGIWVLSVLAEMIFNRAKRLPS